MEKCEKYIAEFKLWFVGNKSEKWMFFFKKLKRYKNFLNPFLMQQNNGFSWPKFFRIMPGSGKRKFWPKSTAVNENGKKIKDWKWKV